MKRDDWIDQQRLLASIDRQIAELFVKRAQILDELADGKTDPRTGRRKQRPHVPAPSAVAVTPEMQARVNKALRDREKRLRGRG